MFQRFHNLQTKPPAGGLKTSIQACGMEGNSTNSNHNENVLDTLSSLSLLMMGKGETMNCMYLRNEESQRVKLWSLYNVTMQVHGGAIMGPHLEAGFWGSLLLSWGLYRQNYTSNLWVSKATHNCSLSDSSKTAPGPGRDFQRNPLQILSLFHVPPWKCHLSLSREWEWFQRFKFLF